MSSSSQKTYAREEAFLEKMPKVSGRAACEGDTRFDILAEREKINQAERNELSRVCSGCDLKTVCGFRQEYKAIGYRAKVEQDIVAAAAEAAGALAS